MAELQERYKLLKEQQRVHQEQIRKLQAKRDALELENALLNSHVHEPEATMEEYMQRAKQQREMFAIMKNMQAERAEKEIEAIDQRYMNLFQNL